MDVPAQPSLQPTTAKVKTKVPTELDEFHYVLACWHG